MYWGQGIDEMPLYQKTCYDAWVELNRDTEFEVCVLDQDAVEDLVPEYHEIFNEYKEFHNLGDEAFNPWKPYRHWQARADLLRLLLLSKYGGIWADATLMPLKPASMLVDGYLNDTGFFSFKYLGKPRESYAKAGTWHRETVVWFLMASAPNNYLVDAWCSKFTKSFIEVEGWPVYFQMHKDLYFLSLEDKKIANILDSMVSVSAKYPHNGKRHDWDNPWRDKVFEVAYVLKRPYLDYMQGLADNIPGLEFLNDVLPSLRKSYHNNTGVKK